MAKGPNYNFLKKKLLNKMQQRLALGDPFQFLGKPQLNPYPLFFNWRGPMLRYSTQDDSD
jgi:hypothetical protein